MVLTSVSTFPSSIWGAKFSHCLLNPSFLCRLYPGRGIAALCAERTVGSNASLWGRTLLTAVGWRFMWNVSREEEENPHRLVHEGPEG